MNTQLDPNIYSRCERAFLSELAKTIDIAVQRLKPLNREEKATLTSTLTFALAAHLSGSSFGGRVEGNEIYPKLGFYKGESNALYFGEGSRLHELVPDVLRELSTNGTSTGSNGLSI